ncbi:hypothetical protein [Paenibacillus sp. JDR-2]|uniref:hypothetical protein n=1 Tax=Paenibacillus sp. (strain JDR-2) TaxID=324057 RepID=UPI00016679C9|nr:hypothetical protein [Paenibacillus sp. JDR-2]ACT02346.1 hypothetical protein Pjdr2_3715 [Paenibacillus sp. JDR-2]
MFEIKYEIFEDHISELEAVDIETFTKEFNQIYGCFTIIINGIEYIPFPSTEMSLETKHIFSELILRHFESLIDAYLELQKNNYVAIKYIENGWTWLEFVRKENELTVSELNIEIQVRNYIQNKNKFFKRAKKVGIINEKIQWSDFETEVITKTIELLNNIKIINSHVLEAKCFDQLRSFGYTGFSSIIHS